MAILFSTQMYRPLPLGAAGGEPENGDTETEHHTPNDGKEKEAEPPETIKGKEKEAMTAQRTETIGRENLFSDAAQQYRRVEEFVARMLDNFVGLRDRPARPDTASILSTIGTKACEYLSLIA